SGFVDGHHKVTEKQTVVRVDGGIAVNNFFGAEVHHLKPMYEGAGIEITIIHQQPVDVGIRKPSTGVPEYKVFKRSGPRIELGDACILSSNADIAFAVPADLADRIS